MLQFLRRKAKSGDRVGLSAVADHITLARVTREDGSPFLEQCLQVNSAGTAERGAALRRVVSENGLDGLPCCYVMSPGDYALHLMEAPKVAASEVKSAVRWKIRDLLDMQPEEAVIDIFPLPGDAHRGRREMLYVVATARSTVNRIVEFVSAAGLKLSVIDIPELAMRNLSLHVSSDEHGLAFMDLRGTGSTMNLSRQGGLYLTRKINTPLDEGVMATAEWETMKERLVLEIQRSLDYYESQMGQSPISQMLIAARPTDAEELARCLDDAMAIKVSALDFASTLSRAAGIDEGLLQPCMMAIGAALRNEQPADAA